MGSGAGLGRGREGGLEGDPPDVHLAGPLPSAAASSRPSADRARSATRGRIRKRRGHGRAQAQGVTSIKAPPERAGAPPAGPLSVKGSGSSGRASSCGPAGKGSPEARLPGVRRAGGGGQGELLSDLLDLDRVRGEVAQRLLQLIGRGADQRAAGFSLYLLGS